MGRSQAKLLLKTVNASRNVTLTPAELFSPGYRIRLATPAHPLSPRGRVQL